MSALGISRIPAVTTLIDQSEKYLIADAMAYFKTIEVAWRGLELVTSYLRSVAAFMKIKLRSVGLDQTQSPSLHPLPTR